jgi:hypothetical protein
MKEPKEPKLPPEGESSTPGLEKEKAIAAGELSSEEQMERYEEDLKENDWGHQPC